MSLLEEVVAIDDDIDGRWREFMRAHLFEESCEACWEKCCVHGCGSANAYARRSVYQLEWLRQFHRNRRSLAAGKAHMPRFRWMECGGETPEALDVLTRKLANDPVRGLLLRNAFPLLWIGSSRVGLGALLKRYESLLYRWGKKARVYDNGGRRWSHHWIEPNDEWRPWRNGGFPRAHREALRTLCILAKASR